MGTRVSLLALAMLSLSVTGCQSSDKPTPAGSESSSSEPSSSPADADGLVDVDALVAEAERLVLADLPRGVPLWKGTTASGHLVSSTVVCVDRTYGTKPPFSKTKNAGYVVVTFPDKTLGEPQDGTCKSMVPESELPPVDVPQGLQDSPGLLVSTDYGDKWPMTVPYGVVTCEDDSVIFEAPDGKRYAVNGTARTLSGLPDITPIWKKDPDIKGLRIDISPVIDAGLRLC